MCVFLLNTGKGLLGFRLNSSVDEDNDSQIVRVKPVYRVRAINQPSRGTNINEELPLYLSQYIDPFETDNGRGSVKPFGFIQRKIVVPGDVKGA